MNLLADGARYLAQIQKAALATPVVLRRSNGEELSLSARVKTTVFDVEVADGRVERWESRAFTFDVSDLAERPREGDTIVESYSGGSSTYRVMAPPGLPPTYFADSYRTGIVVHTKLVQSETVSTA